MRTASPPLTLLVQHYNAHNRSEGKSPRTVGWYQEVLGLFLRWLVNNGHGTTILALSLGIPSIRSTGSFKCFLLAPIPMLKFFFR
jgi:hypothetical protein